MLKMNRIQSGWQTCSNVVEKKKKISDANVKRFNISNLKYYKLTRFVYIISVQNDNFACEKRDTN